MAKKLPFASLLLAVVLGQANAPAVTFNVAGDWLADESGVRGIPNGSLVVLIASTRDAAFAPPDGPGGVAQGSDDIVLGALVVDDFQGALNAGSFTGTIRAFYGDKSRKLGEFGPGDPLLVRWFPTLTAKDLMTPTGDVPYGEFRVSQALPGNDIPWVAPPSDAATVSLTVDANATGAVSHPDGSISLNSLAANRLRRVAGDLAAQLAISASGNGILQVSWPVTSHFQRLQQSDDLKLWKDVSIAPASFGDRARVTIKPEGKGSRFFRLVAP